MSLINKPGGKPAKGRKNQTPQPFAYGSKNFTRSMTYAQLCTTAIKITTFHHKMGVGSGEKALPHPGAPSPGK